MREKAISSMLKKTPYIIMKMSIPNIPALMTRLETQISALKQHYAERLGEKIFIKTDRALFNENYQSIAEFLQEIDTSLQRLQSVKFEQFEYVQLITERLIKQCALLADSAAQNMPKSTTKKKPTRQPTKVSHAVHKLPPRERLEKHEVNFKNIINKQRRALLRQSTKKKKHVILLLLHPINNVCTNAKKQ